MHVAHRATPANSSHIHKSSQQHHKMTSQESWSYQKRKYIKKSFQNFCGVAIQTHIPKAPSTRAFPAQLRLSATHPLVKRAVTQLVLVRLEVFRLVFSDPRVIVARILLCAPFSYYCSHSHAHQYRRKSSSLWFTHLWVCAFFVCQKPLHRFVTISIKSKTAGLAHWLGGESSTRILKSPVRGRNLGQ